MIARTGKLLLLAVLTVLLTAVHAEALLSPEDVLVVVNSASGESERLGSLYMKLRAIPADNLAVIKTPDQENISRPQYNELVASPVKEKVLALRKKGKKIRCIVTVYGVPLKIYAQRPDDSSEEKINETRELVERKKAEAGELEEENRGEKTRDRSKRIEELRAETRKLQMELDHLLGNDTRAAVDSELALLLSPQYELAGWQPNPGFYYLKGKIKDPLQALMVSRLDAPSAGIVEKMVRTAIETEKTGLKGKLYLDARGLSGESAYATFDEDIRRTARLMEKGSMPVVLDNEQELFGPGKAPAAALYCGWYSLAKYVDSFEWVKGAIGYHVASSEAVSLRNPKGTYWVKSMLERGVIASIGPVTEPYLTSFPPPSLFFQFLMSGQYSLGEVFAMSNPVLSWQMILVGDPLYNPFAKDPPYPLKDAPPTPY